MSSPAEFYNSLPPVTKVYGTICLVATAACELGYCRPEIMALDLDLVFYSFQVWRLVTNFFFLGKFSFYFGFRFLMLARYGVQLERGPFARRTADFLWMMIFGALTLLVLPFRFPLFIVHSALAAIPMLWSPFLGAPLIFMLLYVWSKEHPNTHVDIYGVVTLKAFYLPWAVLALYLIYGERILPALMGIVAGHVYYFLSVLHPLSVARTN